MGDDVHADGLSASPPPEDPEAEALLDLLGAMPGIGPEEPGWAVLDVVVEFLERFVCFPSLAAAHAVALWVVHTHAIEAFETSPRLGLMSAEKRSGKSRTLEVLDLLVARPAMAATMSAAVVCRKVEAEQPTLLLDEIDTVFSKGRKRGNEELRGLLNAGQRRGVLAYRCTASSTEPIRAYDPFCAVALAGIGELPSTIADRSVLIRMKRRAPDEVIERFRRRKIRPKAEAVRRRVETWCSAHLSELAVAEPSLPDELDDRAADGWEPLLAIADAAGGSWPARARAAALELSARRTAEEDALGVRLLADLRSVFSDAGADRLSSEDLVERLSALEEAPWGGLGGKPIDVRSLASLLRPFDVRPDSVRFGGQTRKGYLRGWFDEAWRRYLPE